MYSGIEVDVLALGDADCIIVTQWVYSTQGRYSFPHRVLIDGGSGADAEYVIDFLLSRGYTDFWAAVCTHPHIDHARGLIKVVQNRSITIHNGWMPDIRNHVRVETLRRASAADDGVKEVVETTEELARAFASRNIIPQEPFEGISIAFWPSMTVLGPSLPFYARVVEEFTKIEVLPPVPVPWPWSSSTSGLGADALRSVLGLEAIPPPARYTSLSTLISAPPSPGNFVLSFLSLAGALSRSTVQENPTTQPFNNTSVILGVMFNGRRLLFTGDAGSEALGQIPAEWNHLLYMGVPHHGSDGNLSQQDNERFWPEFAVISARGDSSHPSRAIVSGLAKVGTTVCSTHKSGHLWFWSGSVPYRADYGPAEPLKGTGGPEPVLDWTKILLGTK